MGRSLLDTADPPANAQGGDMLFTAPQMQPGTAAPLIDATVKDVQVQRDAAGKISGATIGSGNTVDGEGSGKGAAIVAAAKSQLGVRYVYGAHQWGQALDCSGLTQLAMQHAGINIGGNTYTQVTQGTAVQGGLAAAQPGDLIFTVGDIGMRTNGHVGVYMGNGQVIAAPHTGSQVQIQDWSARPITAIRRYV